MAPQKNRRPGFSRRAQYGLFLGYVVAIAGALVGGILLALSTFHPPAFSAVRGAVAEVTTPISSGLDWVRDGIASVPAGIGDYLGVVSENRELKARVKAQHDLVQRSRTLARENLRLRALLRVRDRTPETVVTARLVNSSATSTRRFATLNAGFWQNVRVGQPVRGPEGLVGRVIETSPNTARVLLIIDPESIVPVRRTRDGTPAIAAGRGDGLLDIRSAGIANVQFQAGDMFVTSGTGGLYPPNTPVARVTRAGQDTAEAQAYANPDSLDFALVQRPFIDVKPEQPAQGSR